MPLNADLMKSTAVHYEEEELDSLQLNIFSQDSRHFEIVSQVSFTSYANWAFRLISCLGSESLH